ncbi:hypothetical protein PIB30_050409 [Stylosanthes scabra]|uniref:SKI-interacting protein SKIP SNW domain-containing protein n=1 Tax=Stylosanthes scabra TaxID=79078 RepID=A0ABU6WIM4_9FABA|nr:hypothetical protein [Stylosanthes scabra]
MAALKELLPPAKSSSTTYYDHSNDPWFKQRFSSSSEEEKAAAIKLKPVPPYMKRAGFVPRKVEDFGDGGAFPEIHVAQYPLDMGRNKSSKPGSKILPVTVDAHGNVAYDAIVKQNENAKKIVYTQQKDLIPKILKNEEEGDMEDDEDEQKEIEETTQETKAALEKIVNVRLSAAQPKNVPKQSADTKYIKYKPSQQNAAFNSGAKERVVRMFEMPVDPLEPPKFKHKRVPKASGSPPVPVMHSPPRPVTEREERLHREKIREERRRERERERRLEAKDAAMGKKSKLTRDRDRDISEKVALGMASTKAGTEVMYDERLFNQEKGISSGFATDDQYNVYDKGLFTAQPTLSTLYRPKKDVDNEVYGGADEQLEKIRKTDRFKPDRGFAGTSEKSGPRDRPVEFENQDEADPFGLDQFLTDVKSGKKAMENVGSGGTMRASGGSSMRDGYEGGSGRTRIGFERGH